MREIGLDSEYSRGKWELTAKGQGGVSGWKITRRKHQGSGEILDKPLTRILAGGRVTGHHHLGVPETEEPD